jgi:hypothetical protein
LFGQVMEQVFVGCIEGLQRFVLLFWLADQVEAGEGVSSKGMGRGSG